jgi:hypothetical protein
MFVRCSAADGAPPNRGPPTAAERGDQHDAQQSACRCTDSPDQCDAVAPNHRRARPGHRLGDRTGRPCQRPLVESGPRAAPRGRHASRDGRSGLPYPGRARVMNEDFMRPPLRRNGKRNQLVEGCMTLKGTARTRAPRENWSTKGNHATSAHDDETHRLPDPGEVSVSSVQSAQREVTCVV